MKCSIHCSAFAFALLVTASSIAASRAAEIAVVTAPESSSAERIAAAELTTVLAGMYPKDRFVSAPTLPVRGMAILIGPGSSELVRRHLPGPSLAASESHVVQHVIEGDREIGVIAGADPRGTVYGVYAVLERLGCHFHLSGDALPPPRTTAFGFDEWPLAGRPLTPERIVFNWHNFLSGCSTWNQADWRLWTSQSQKMGYNAIMVHAYGNNPMAGFPFDGARKPVGHLSTTIKGRDWSTIHVNDVRRLFGGEVFDGSAFGADAGFAPEGEREAAAQALMQAVFADAAERAMNVYFAVDVDTPSANPQELVLRLPEAARFEIGWPANPAFGALGRLWVPNPDTPEGHAFYRAQVSGLMKTYPTITHLVVWFRRGGTPWMNVKLSELPPAWQREFAAEIARTPEAEKYWLAPGLFAVGRIVRSFERALREIRATETQVAAGTWGFDFLPGADHFFPPGVPLIGLDYDVLHDRPQLGTADSRAVLRKVAARRPVIPIVWAHHDDGHYVGRPYTPLPEFASKLDDARVGGFGIIHWTTRPLDLYFSSLAKQVWSGTRNQPLAETCRAAAGPWFGEENRALMGDYLESWMSSAPRFGRETSDWFIDRKRTGIPEIVAGCRERLAKIAAARTANQTAAQRDRLAYYRGLEEWMAAFHEAHGRFQDSQDLLTSGDRDGARRMLAGFQPGSVIQQFASLSSLGGITRGEQGLVVTMNTRWFSHIVRHRQALGLEPVRINFAPTSHDFLAQSPGTFTFHFDPQRALWECWGEQETGAEVFAMPEDTHLSHKGLPAAVGEIGRTGVVTTRPLTFTLRPIMAVDSRNKVKPAPLPGGDYRLRLLLVEPDAASPGQHVFEVAVRAGATADAPFATLERLDVVQLAGGRHRVIERMFPIHLGPGGGDIELRLTPVQGRALLCGVIVEPVAVP